MKGKQRARIILNGTWFVQQTSPNEYIVYHEWHENGSKRIRKKAVAGCVRDALDYIMNNWYIDAD